MSTLLMRSSGLIQSTITRIELFIILNILDYALTGVMIRQGLGSEGNPLLAWLPFWGIGLVKIGVVYLVARHLRNRITVMALLNIGMGMVVVWNMAWLILLG